MRHFYLWALLFILIQLPVSAQHLPANGRANENYIWLFQGKKLQKIFPIGTVRTEIVNEHFNISATCESGGVFEINGLTDNILKDTTIQMAKADLVFIRSGKGGTWKNAKHLVTTMRIHCASNNPGAPVRVYVKGKLIKGKSSRIVEVQFNANIPQKQYLKNDIH